MTDAERDRRTPGVGTFLTIILGLLAFFAMVGRLGRMPTDKFDALEQARQTPMVSATAYDQLRRQAVEQGREKASVVIGARPVDPLAQREVPMAHTGELPEREWVPHVVQQHRLPVDREARAQTLVPFTESANAAGQQADAGPRPRRHCVKANETLFQIARQYHATDPNNYVRQLREANPELRNGRLRQGMELVLPAAAPAPVG